MLLRTQFCNTPEDLEWQRIRRFRESGMAEDLEWPWGDVHNAGLQVARQNLRASIDGHGLNLLLRQQLPADGFPLLRHLQVSLCLLEVIPELALIVGQGLKKWAGGAIQGMRLILNAAWRWSAEEYHDYGCGYQIRQADVVQRTVVCVKTQ
ncbi:MAG: hypothetical protein FRX49_08480 [Trebouxia sp. A1-2]|nr:MAG: hypothetical protein FRX49_08480 [Trebouxia sp. A1-2]